VYHQIPKECAIMFYTQCILKSQMHHILCQLLDTHTAPHKQVTSSLSDSILDSG